MASIVKRTTEAGVRYDVRYRDDKGKQRKQTFRRKVDAERFAVTVQTDVLRGTYIDPTAGKITFGDFVESRWLPAQLHLRPNTAETYKAHLKNHVKPAFEGREIRSIQRADMKNFVAAISATLKPSTVSTVFAVVRSVMATAVDDGLIAANPCARVPLPRVERRVVEPLSAESVLALVEAMTKRYRVTVWLGAGAGLREGEALGLLASRVDFLKRRIHVEEQMQGRNGKDPKLSPLKTRASRRVVPVDDVVLNAITNHMQLFPTQDGLLVTNRLGKPIRRSSFGTCWREAVEVAGLPKGTRFHDLRHFYASSLIAANLHPKAIQARLGHATMAETMDTYGHLFPDAEDAGRGALDAMLAKSDAPSVCHEAEKDAL